MSPGSYTTISKTSQGGALPREHYFYLDFVYVDIAFGDYALVGGFCYALIFVDWATHYDWVLASRISHVILSLQLSASSRLTQAPMLDAFIAIATPNFLAPRFVNILLIMDSTLLPPPLVVSRQMAWWKLIGKLWSTCPRLN